MKVLYTHLVEGYILTKGDTLLIHGYEYLVVGSSDTHFYLEHNKGPNSTVINYLRIEDKMTLARRFDPDVKRGNFPEFSSLDLLTKFVKYLYEMSPYKVGDYVKIQPREHKSGWYPFDYVDSMTDYIGKTACITSISIESSTENYEGHNGDPHKYALSGPDGINYYNWHSSEFVKSDFTDVDFKVTSSKESEPKFVDNFSRESIIKIKIPITKYKTIIKL